MRRTSPVACATEKRSLLPAAGRCMMTATTTAKTSSLPLETQQQIKSSRAPRQGAKWWVSLLSLSQLKGGQSDPFLHARAEHKRAHTHAHTHKRTQAAPVSRALCFCFLCRAVRTGSSPARSSSKQYKYSLITHFLVCLLVLSFLFSKKQKTQPIMMTSYKYCIL